jgi:hypothetical protein
VILKLFCSVRLTSGRQEWWFLPDSETSYIQPTLALHGQCCHSKHFRYGDHSTSSWFKRLHRYRVILEPGDILIIPPWFWNAMNSLGDENDNTLVIDVVTSHLLANKTSSMLNLWL